jgi:hypothetical protein
VTPNSGLYLGGPGDKINAPFPITQLSAIQLRWRDLQTGPSTYNWAPIDNVVNHYTNEQWWLRIYYTDNAYVPAYIKNLGLQTRPWVYSSGYSGAYPSSYQDPWINNSDQSTWNGIFYYPWDARFDAEWNKFLSALQAHLSQNPQIASKIKFAYIPGYWRWGEYQVWQDERTDGTQISGSGFVTWQRKATNAWINALGTIKPVWTGMSHREIIVTGNRFTNPVLPDWQQAINTSQTQGGNEPANYAISTKATGARSGFTEKFNNFSWEDSWGSHVVTDAIDGKRYMVPDEKHPLIAATDRYFGTENEYYVGPSYSNSYYRLRMEHLLMLSLRMNWDNISVNTRYATQYQPFMNWVFKELGKHYYDAADAWTVLRQWIDENPNTGDSVNNWERWLSQRDVAGGKTVVTDQVSGINRYPSYEARRTDHASGNNYIYFNVNDLFLKGGSNNIRVYVSYLDNSTSPFYLEYDAADGNHTKRATSSFNIVFTKSEAWKTGYFALPDAAFSNGQASGMDFRLYNGGSRDLTVRFVRVVKMTPVERAPKAPTNLR